MNPAAATATQSRASQSARLATLIATAQTVTSTHPMSSANNVQS